MDDITILGY